MAVDLFLKLTKSGSPIKGECQDQPFQGLIQLQSFQMSALSLLAAPSGATSSEAGAADACSFTVKKLLDSSSPDLFLNYTQAQIPERRSACLLEGTVYFRSDGPQPMKPTADSVSFLALEFKDVFVYDYSIDGDQEAPRPVEEVKFYFDKYRLTYRDPYAADGTSLRPPRCVGWDFEAGKPL